MLLLSLVIHGQSLLYSDAFAGISLEKSMKRTLTYSDLQASKQVIHIFELDEDL